MIEKAIASEADAIFIDLEDAVAPADKEAARHNVIRAFRELDWGRKEPAFRINALDTLYWYRDVIDVVEQTADRIDLVIVPKVEGPEQVHALDALLYALEARTDAKAGLIGLELQIETARGLTHVEEIAGASSSIDVLIFGPGDFAASVGMPLTHIGVEDRWDDLYPGHRFHYAMSRVVTAARAAGCYAIDGPVANFRDLDAMWRSSMIARSLGFDGKWCIHPSQIPVANEAFSPTEEEVATARAVIEGFEKLAQRGVGVVDGMMVDAASVKLAKQTLDRAQRTGRL